MHEHWTGDEELYHKANELCLPGELQHATFSRYALTTSSRSKPHDILTELKVKVEPENIRLLRTRDYCIKFEFTSTYTPGQIDISNA